MNRGDEQPLVTYRLQRARETFQDALLLFDQGGSPPSVINRSYYAMFYAVLAMRTTLGKGSSKHSGVISLFDQYFVKTGKVSESMSKALHKAFDIRQIGDYRELYQLDREQAEEILRSAEQFLAAVEAHLLKS